ncbi:MAG TPA: chorismate mutase [Gaiellaceae bacterium]
MSTDITSASDEFVRDVRREISDLDSALVELVNKRLRLVAKLKRYKEEHGIGFVDLARESGCCNTSNARTAARCRRRGSRSSTTSFWIS